MKILTAQQMQSIDARTTQRFAIPSLILMENDIDVEADLRRFASDGDGGELGMLLREWGFAA